LAPLLTGKISSQKNLKTKSTAWLTSRLFKTLHLKTRLS